MNTFSETQLEQLALDWLHDLGWTHIFGPDIAVSVRERALATDSRNFGDTTMVTAFIGWTFRLADIGTARRARAEIREREVTVAAAEKRVEAEVHASVARARTLERSVEQAHKGLGAAEQSHRIQLARFEAGSALGVEVVQAQNAVARARLELVDTILRFNAEHVNLLALTGHLDPDSLAGPRVPRPADP